MAMKIILRIKNAHYLKIECCCYNQDRNEIYTGSQDCLIKAWDMESGRQLRVQQSHTNWVMGLIYVANPVKMLFSCSLDATILTWNDTGRLLQVIEYGGPVYCLAWDSKQRQLFAGGRGVVQIFKVLRPSKNYMQMDSEKKSSNYVKFLEFVYCVLAHEDTVQAICCSRKGKVFTTGVDRTICIFESDRPEETLRKVNFVHVGGVTAATFDTDANLLVTGGYDGSVNIWSPEGHCLDSFPNLTDLVTSIAYLPSTHTYWVSGKHRSVVVIDPVAPAIITQWVADTSQLQYLLLHKVYHVEEKDMVIGLSDEHEIIVWRYDCFIPHRVLHGHANWIQALVVAHRRPLMERLLRRDLSNVQPGKALKPAPADPREREVRFNAKGLREDGLGKPVLVPNPAEEELEMYSGSSDGFILRWVPDAEPHRDIWAQSELSRKPSSAIVCILYHPELDLLLTGSTDSLIRVWSMDSQENIPLWRGGDMHAKGPDLMKGHVDMVVGLAACKKLVVVSASADKTLKWWNMCTRLVTDTVQFGSEFPFQDMAYSDSREELATCGGSNIVKVWNEFTKQTMYLLQGELPEEIIMVKWCRSNEGLWVTGGSAGTVSTWNPDTAAPMNTLNFRNQAITSLLVDEHNDALLLCSLHDASIHMFGLGSFQEQVSFSGHQDQVHAMVHISTRNQYLSSSWDLTLCVWLIPDATSLTTATSSSGRSKLQTDEEGDGGDTTPAEAINWGDDAKPYMSQYERDHPAVMPKVLEAHLRQTKSEIVSHRFQSSHDPDLKLSMLHLSSSSSPSATLDAAHLGASLLSKIDHLEAQLKPS